MGHFVTALVILGVADLYIPLCIDLAVKGPGIERRIEWRYACIGGRSEKRDSKDEARGQHHFDQGGTGRVRVKLLAKNANATDGDPFKDHRTLPWGNRQPPNKHPHLHFRGSKYESGNEGCSAKGLTSTSGAVLYGLPSTHLVQVRAKWSLMDSAWQAVSLIQLVAFY